LDSWPLKGRPIGCSETLVGNYHHSVHNNPEWRSSHLLRGGSLKLLRCHWYLGDDTISLSNDPFRLNVCVHATFTVFY
jgi:hypothetical protein